MGYNDQFDDCPEQVWSAVLICAVLVLSLWIVFGGS